MLQYRQRIINALIDRAVPTIPTIPHMTDLRYLGLTFDSGQALELCPRLAFLADHRPQPIADALAVRNQLRTAPPILVIHVQQLAADDHQTHQHHAAHDAEKKPDDPIQGPEP